MAGTACQIELEGWIEYEEQAAVNIELRDGGGRMGWSQTKRINTCPSGVFSLNSSSFDQVSLLSKPPLHPLSLLFLWF
jgi:hypothetical protein